MRRRASSTRAPTRRLDSPSRRRWRAGDPYWPRRAEVRSRSWGMRECSRLQRTRAALRPSGRALRRELRDLAADVVLVGGARDIRLAAFASLGRSLAVVYCISTPRPPRDLRTRLAFRRVAFTVFLTEQLAQSSLAEAPFMRRAGHRVIPNGVDCDLFHPNEDAGQAFRRRRQLGDRPVLAASGGGTPELLGNAGVLAPPENPVVFAGLLRELLGDAPRRASLAVAARQRAVERYSVARMIRDYEEMLEDLV